VTRRASLVFLVLALIFGVMGLLTTPSAAQGGGSSSGLMQVELDRSSVELGIGQGFGFTSMITNVSDRPLHALVAHLNVASVDGKTYVDPEDWSSNRTQYVASLAPQETRRLSWSVHAVNHGELVLYVAVTTRSGPDVVIASDPLRARVTAVRTIDASSVLPVAIAVPAVFVVLLALALNRRRQLA
jgi:hypothetical protein